MSDWTTTGRLAYVVDGHTVFIERGQITERGLWSPGVFYNFPDVVEYAGAHFIAVKITAALVGQSTDWAHIVPYGGEQERIAQVASDGTNAAAAATALANYALTVAYQGTTVAGQAVAGVNQAMTIISNGTDIAWHMRFLLMGG